MSTHSVIEHRANYYYVELKEDYLALCAGTKYAHCKALVLYVLENWTNEKKAKGKSLYVYMTYPQWIDSLFGMYGRNAIIESLNWLEKEGLISKRPYRYDGKDTFAYMLNIEPLQARLKTLSEKPSNSTRPNLNAFKNKRVQKSTGLEEDGIGVQKSTGAEQEAFKKGRIIESITQNQDIESDISFASAHDAHALTEEKPHSQKETKPRGKSKNGLSLQGQHILDLFQSFKGRKSMPGKSTINAANGLVELIASDEEFLGTLAEIRDNKFLSDNQIAWDLEFVFRKYERYRDLAESKKKTKLNGVTPPMSSNGTRNFTQERKQREAEMRYPMNSKGLN